MNISGIAVVIRADEFEGVASELRSLPGVEIHQTDAEAGKLVLTQEAENVHEEIDGLKRIKAIPGVVFAEMAYHYFEGDVGKVGDISAGLKSLESYDAPLAPNIPESPISE